MGQAPETRYTRNGDVHIAYQTLGKGPSDLLLFFGSNVSIDSMDDEPALERFHRRLSSFSRVIRFDHRGLGLSDPLTPSSRPVLEQWVDDAIAVMDAAGSETAAVLGDQDAACKAILMAATHPDRVSRLIIVNGTARVIRAPDYPVGIPEELMNGFIDVVTEPDAVDRGVDDVALFAPSMREDRAFRSWWVQSGRRGASPAVARALVRVDTFADVRDLLPIIRVPTLVLHRRDCLTLTVGHGRYLAEHIPGVTYVELPGADALHWIGDTDLLLAEIEEFLTGARHEHAPDRVLATVLFTDIVDSTAQASALGDRSWRELLDAHDTMVRRQLMRFRGREINTTGDGFLATFDGPARAIDCASAIANGAHQLGIEVRMGLHTGEVELRGDDIGGVAVHIGARVAALAGAGEVLVSRTVTDLVAGSGIHFEDRGVHELKGVPGSWRLFSVAS